MNSQTRSATFTPTPSEELEDLIFMDEYTRSNLKELILSNQEIMKELENKHPKYAAQLKNGFRASQLVEKGISANLEEAEKLVKSMRSHRKPLQFCRDAADQYVSQLTDKEFNGFFRMSYHLFDRVVNGTILLLYISHDSYY